ncbi:MAG: FAD-binding oxidoreductase [Actinobacteria bacterium]|nr:FAD-binding oxidoreductase [Actinomycetota bacterium]
MSMSSQNNVTVIGGGIVGLACAWELAKDGASVIVVETGGSSYGTSLANAGWISPSHIIPFAAPGMVQTGFKNLVGRTGAFAMTPGAGSLLAPWTLKFARSCTDAHVDHCAPALKELLDTSMDVIEGLTETTDLKRTNQPQWYVYTSDKAEADAEHEVDLVTKYGVDAKQLDLATSLEAEPILKNTVKAVVEFSSDFGLDPGKLVEVYRRNCEAIGVAFRDEKVTAMSSTSRNVTVVTETDSWISDYVVLAAGVWSRELAKTLGENLPIMPAKGQSVTLPEVIEKPTRTLMLADQRIATNPLDWGLRMSTGFSLTSSSDMSVNSKASDKLIATARQVLNLPERIEIKNELAGLRPASPDGLPYIGALPKAPRVIAATGHGMLGLMMGPGTGKFVADLIAGRQVSRDVLKFSPARPRL